MSDSRETYLLRLYLDRGTRRARRASPLDAATPSPRERATSRRPRWARLLAWLWSRAIR
ncbi:MAG TPA: hypothetical protein VFW70_13930 [Methylomirabilota bacterium]|nr:hypothetical protein [Methylomirabilota bacterium]